MLKFIGNKLLHLLIFNNAEQRHTHFPLKLLFTSICKLIPSLEMRFVCLTSTVLYT